MRGTEQKAKLLHASQSQKKKNYKFEFEDNESPYSIDDKLHIFHSTYVAIVSHSGNANVSFFSALFDFILITLKMIHRQQLNKAVVCWSEKNKRKMRLTKSKIIFIDFDCNNNICIPPSMISLKVFCYLFISFHYHVKHFQLSHLKVVIVS